MAALGAEVLLPGHGVPIVGAARVGTRSTTPRSCSRRCTTRPLALMNAGAPLDEILRAMSAPAHLADAPYLRPIYDEPEFIVRNVWRLYGGWWDGDPAALKPPPATALAREVAAMAGGAAALVTRAEERAAAGELALACQLVEWAAQAAPDDEGIVEARRKIYRARAETETSLMARSIFRDAADRGAR